jgi:hypothetical protein
MGGVVNKETADFYDISWASLNDSAKSSLVYTLNLDGLGTEPAVQPTYFPALLKKGYRSCAVQTPQ